MFDPGLWQFADVDESSQVGAARRMAARLSDLAQLSELAAGHVALVATELATNLFKHARRGQLLMRAEGEGEAAVIDLLSIDHGPGMDLEACFRDGYSTRGTSGTGLGAVQRLTTLFDAFSDARGSVLFARLGTLAGPPRGSVALPLRGELVSGDRWRFAVRPDGWALAVVDGLGHGPSANAAAGEAIAAHEAAPDDPGRFLELAHQRSRGSRGSACAAVRFRDADGSLVHAGVGNVAAQVIGRDGSRGLVSQSGTLGAVCPRIHPTCVEEAAGALLVMHSDGITSRWSLAQYPGLQVRHPQVIAGLLYRDAYRQRDDATVVVVQM